MNLAKTIWPKKNGDELVRTIDIPWMTTARVIVKKGADGRSVVFPKELLEKPSRRIYLSLKPDIEELNPCCDCTYIDRVYPYISTERSPHVGRGLNFELWIGDQPQARFALADHIRCGQSISTIIPGERYIIPPRQPLAVYLVVDGNVLRLGGARAEEPG